MKKIFFSVIAIIAISLLSIGTAKADGVYEGVAPGSSIIGAKVGLSNIVGANVAYDYALARVWKGTFTIGGQIGYMWWSDKPSGEVRDGDNILLYSYKNKSRKDMLDFKIRTTYRFYVVVPEWEVYAGVGLGGVASLEKTKQERAYEGGKIETIKGKDNKGFVSGSFIVGTTYYFTQQIGVNLELNFGRFEQAWVNIGINIKL